MDPKLQEMLGRIGELTDDELKELEKGLTDEFDRLDKESKTPGNVDEMGKVADALDQVRAESDNRTQAAADAERRAEELRGRVHKDGEDGDEQTDQDNPNADDPGGAGDGAPVVPTTDDPHEDPAAGEPAGGADGDEDEDDTEGKGKGKGIAASAARGRRAPIGSFGGGKGKAPAPKALQTSSRTRSMVNSTSAQKLVGDTFDDFDQVVLAMHDRIGALGRGTGETFTVARVEVAYPDERKLINNDPVHNMKVMEATTGANALVASGGICTPVDVDYDILVVADDDEPVAGDLPTYNAGRGGLRFIIPPTLWEVGSAGTTIWTHEQDAATPYPNADGTLPNGTTVKPVQRFVCGDEDEVLVDAIPTRFQFGNMMGRFSPEVVEANTRLALANAARFREIHRLNQIAAYSTSVSSGQLLGAARDLLATMDLVMAAYRYRNRISRTGVNLRAILPSYAIDMLRADFTRSLSYGSGNDNLTLSDADVEALITSRGWAVTWTLDNQPTNAAAGPGGALAFPDQTFGTAGATVNPQGQGALIDWPRTMVWYVFAEGTFQRLDGGTLDLGVVRDPTYNSVNVYETFVEVYEAIAKRGIESLQVLSQLRPNGAAAGTVGTATSPVVY
jgi:hypothetical protein